jgi:transcription termination factor NusB
MNNRLKSKTRLSFIQIIFQHLSTNNDVNEILNTFDKNYKSTFVDNFNNDSKIKFEFNSTFLKKLVDLYVQYIANENYLNSINKHIDFNRKFEKWDIINQSILLAVLSEIKQTEISKIKIIFNDYLNVSKFFIGKADLGFINGVADNIIKDFQK